MSLCKVSALNSKIKLALIAENWLSLSRFAPAALAIDAVHFSDKLATKSRIRFWKKRGVKVRVWTVNRVARAIKLSKIGANGVITDSELMLKMS